MLDELKRSGAMVLSGEKAKDLFTTYGMPFEITRDIVKEHGLEVDETGFKVAMEEHKDKSRETRTKLDQDSEQVEVYRQLVDELQNQGKLGENGVAYDPYNGLE